MDSMTQLGMTAIDLNADMCKGPCYSFTYYNGRSYLDHCVISNDLMPMVDKCNIIDDDLHNVSDHLAISVTIKALPPIRYDITNRQQVSWHKVTPEDIDTNYAIPLEHGIMRMLREYDMDMELIHKESDTEMTKNGARLNDIMSSFTNEIHRATMNMPKTKFSKALKPYWDQELTGLSKRSKQATWEWIDAGRPKENNNEIYERYKTCKAEFRREQRRKVYLYEKQCLQDLSDTETIDQRYFWYLVNRNKRRLNIIQPIHNDSMELITDANGIRTEWNGYFKKLYQSEISEKYDNEFRIMIEKEMEHIHRNIP